VIEPTPDTPNTPETPEESPEESSAMTVLASSLAAGAATFLYALI